MPVFVLVIVIVVVINVIVVFIVVYFVYFCLSVVNETIKILELLKNTFPFVFIYIAF